jgi:hypothetical protein
MLAEVRGRLGPIPREMKIRLRHSVASSAARGFSEGRKAMACSLTRQRRRVKKMETFSMRFAGLRQCDFAGESRSGASQERTAGRYATLRRCGSILSVTPCLSKSSKSGSTSGGYFSASLSRSISAYAE